MWSSIELSSGFRMDESADLSLVLIGTGGGVFVVPLGGMEFDVRHTLRVTR